MSGGHDHAIPDSGNERALWMVLGLTSIFLVTEVIAGIVFKSLALLADLAHMFTHVAALAICRGSDPGRTAARRCQAHLLLSPLRDPGGDFQRRVALRRGPVHPV